MTSEADRILERAKAVNAALEDPGLEPSARRSLETEQAELRVQAQRLAAAGRHPQSVEAEIAMIEERIAAIDAMQITKGYSEKHLSRTVQDPGAYRYAINRMLDDEHRTEVAELEQRLAELRQIQSASADDEEDG